MVLSFSVRDIFWLSVISMVASLVLIGVSILAAA